MFAFEWVLWVWEGGLEDLRRDGPVVALRKCPIPDAKTGPNQLGMSSNASGNNGARGKGCRHGGRVANG